MQSTTVSALCLLALCCVSVYVAAHHDHDHDDDIHLDDDTKHAAKHILEYVKGAGKGVMWNKLATFVDTIGPRPTGSPQLENGLDYMVERLKEDGFDNVHTEAVPAIPFWERNEESLTLLEPFPFHLHFLGYGASVGTSPDITAEVIVVNDLTQITAAAKGKIVLLNPYCDWAATPRPCYAKLSQNRFNGAPIAAKFGALALLLRSVGSFSLATPHTGAIQYAGLEPGVPKIPMGAMTLEEADMFARMAQRGQRIVVRLAMGCVTHPDVKSRNVVAELTGSEHPEQVVIVSAHMDSWDVGQGAMDDGSGVVVSWQVLAMLKQLGIRPKRTLRLVLWTSEEYGGQGGAWYFLQHQQEAGNISMVFETDAMGTFKPQGLEVAGGNVTKVVRVMRQIGKLLKSIDASTVEEGTTGLVTDVKVWKDKLNMPIGALVTNGAHYYWLHHTPADFVTVFNSDDMDLCLATWGIYVLGAANYESLMPRA